MKQPARKLGVGLNLILLFFLVSPLRAMAATPPALATPTGLSLAEIKITGNEFLMLQNNTGSTIQDLSVYWIYVFNNSNPLASGVSSSTQQLPGASLANGQTVLLSAAGGSTCGAAVTAKLSVSLTDSTGYIEIVQQSLNANNQLIQTAIDSTSWGSATSAANGQIGTVPSSSADPANAYYRYSNLPNVPNYLWQKADVDSANSCQMDVASTPADTGGNVNPLGSGPPPPAVILSSVNVATTSLPASDIGLNAPIINELLPNPTGTGTDDTDEYIELYNSNDAVFDLSGFKLETGLTTKHDYVFPDGTLLAPKSFKAFFSADTGLTLSNTSGQAWLIDPMGNIIAQTEAYSTAKDGQAWALASGNWYWTSDSTPNAANIINGVAAASVKAKKSITTSGTNNSQGKATVDALGTNTASQPAQLHPWTLAGVGTAALLYAGYEYRNDLAGHIYRLRRYAEARRATRK